MCPRVPEPPPVSSQRSRSRERLEAPAGSRVLLLATGAAIIAIWAAMALSHVASSRASTVPVNVFPTPGARFAAPSTQITFRGVPAGQLGGIVVAGSKSGPHSGRVLGDSDGRGGSFLPATAFTAGERVTVSTGLNVVRGRHGSFSFTVATPSGGIPGRGALRPAARVKGDVERFVSDRGLVPATVEVTKLPSHSASGYIFVGSQQGPVQNGPMILGPYGGLIWFKPVPRGDTATDFRVQTYHREPVLTWWQGRVSAAGTGAGEDEIYDSSYRPVATVKAGNGLSSDLHEFQLRSQNTALVTAYYPVYTDGSSVGLSQRTVVLDSVVQEIDIPTGLVLFQWDSLDHVGLGDSHEARPTVASHPYDYFHINSIQQAADGSLLVSARDTFAAYDISHQTGAVIWQLGGRHSSFRMGRNTSFAFQHDIRLRKSGLITIFDDGAGPPVVHKQSRALTLRLDFKHKRATLVAQDEHRPPLLAFYEGNVQGQPNNDDFVGWGQQPYFTEFDSRGHTVFDARFVGANSSYRSFRSRWSGQPATRPGIGTRVRSATTTVYASWNGATDVAKWRVLGGAGTTSLKAVATSGRKDFETSIRISRGSRYVAAQALDRQGRVLASSPTVKAR